MTRRFEEGEYYVPPTSKKKETTTTLQDIVNKTEHPFSTPRTSSGGGTSSSNASRRNQTRNTSSSKPSNSTSPISPPAIARSKAPVIQKDVFGGIVFPSQEEVKQSVEQRYSTPYDPKYYRNVRKSNIAGSPENYDEYLNIVRSHPEFVALHSISTPYLGLDLAFASNERGVNGASEREEILIRQLHEWKGSPKSKGDVVRMWTNAIPNNPFVQIAGSEAAGMAIGKVVGGVSGRVAAKYGPEGVKWFNRSQLFVGGVFAAPQAIDMGETAQRGEWGEFAGKSIMFGATFTSGTKGYTEGVAAPKLWGKYKGLNSYEAAISKTINNPKFNPNKVRFLNNPLAKDVTVLKSEFNPTRIKMTNAQYMIKQDIYANKVNPKFPDTTLSNVESLNRLPPAPKKGLTNTILGMTREKGVDGYGGAFSPKDTTHDVDLAFRSGKKPTILEYIIKKLDIGNEKVVDTHKMLSVGERTELLGATRRPSVKTESGVRRIDVRDQFDRISQGAVFSPAKREDKDIVNSINLIKKIYAKQYPEGIPEESLIKIKHFEDVYTRAGKTKDFIITESSEKQIYNPGKLWEYQQKFYKKVLPESYLEKKFIDYTKYPKDYIKGDFNKKPYDPIKRLIDRLPDVPSSVSPALRSPSFGFMFPSSFFGKSSGGVKGKSSAGSSSSKSKSYSPSPVKYKPSPSPVKYTPSPSPPKSPPYSPPSKSPPSSPPPSSPPPASPPYSPPSKSPPSPPPYRSPPSSPSKSLPSSPSKSPPPPYYPMIYPSPSISGRGTRGYNWKQRQDQYKFRKAKIGSVFGDFKEIKIKEVDF